MLTSEDYYTLITTTPKSYVIHMLGASGSGCSSFLENLCDEVSLEKEEIRRRQLDKAYQTGEKEGGGPIIDFGKIYIPPESLFYFFSHTHNYIHSRHKSIQWEFINEKSLGFVVMVDSTTPETFNLTRAIIHNISHLTSVPYVVAANKQDLYNAWTADDIRIALSVSPEIPVIPCSTHNKKLVANVMVALCEEIIKDIEQNDEVY